MMDFFVENNKIPVKDNYDVIVVGGGVAGVSAALAARRSGCSTLIIEKSVYLGGLATLGLITYYEPLCNGKGKKILGGIAEELLHASIKYGHNTLPSYWASGKSFGDEKKRYATHFSPSAFTIALDEIIQNEGIDILLDTLFSIPVIEDGICKGIIVENKTGRVGYCGKVIIDTSGDLDVMSRAGATFEECDNWQRYSYYYSTIEDMKTAVETGHLYHGIKRKALGFNRLGTGAPADTKKYKGTDAKEVTSFILEGRKLLLENLKSEIPQQKYLLMLPGMAQFRTTRRLKGCYELTENDKFKHFYDSIGCIPDFSKAGDIYEIPYRTLITNELKNVITAGRTISSIGHAWEVTRVIPPACLTGQASGIAAALSASLSCSIAEVPIAKLQDELQASGVMLHY